MLAPAIKYKDEINKKSLDLMYTDKAYYFTGGFSGDSEITIGQEADRFQYAILDKDEVIGYLSYWIDFKNAKACSFGIINFTDKPNPIIGLDIAKEMKRLLSNKRIHKISWYGCKDNPAFNAYSKFCLKYNGNILPLKDDYVDKDGNFKDNYIFEIIKEETK